MTAALLAATLAGAAAGDPPAIGDPIGACEFVDVRFRRRELAEFGAKRAFVLYFTRVECPFAPRCLPALAELERRFGGEGVQFVGVNVGADDSVVDAAAQALDHGIAFPFVRDWRHSTARACGATRAGEAVLLDGGLRLRYRGRVDGRLRVGGEGPPTARADLAEAIAELLAGGEVSVPETRAEGCLISPPPAPRGGVDYARDVAPILARRCVECHREEGDAPFPLADYHAAADHAAMIGEVVELGRMPPWHASAAHGRFENDRRLPAAERRALLDWAAAGAPAGDLASATAPDGPARAPEWRIGAPDLVLATPTEMRLPAAGVVPYQYTVLPFVFAADTWVEAVEIRPRNRRAMHHCNLAHVRLGDPFTPENFVTGHVPGGDPLVLDAGTALRIPGGSLLGLQIHYVTTGREETDRIEVALRFPRDRVLRRLRHLQVTDLRFAIPPGAPSHPVRASRTLEHDAIGIGMYAHMHLRGRDMRFTAIAPGDGPEPGARETLLLIPTFDFDWQASYRWPAGARRFAAGTRIECLAHFDNSPFNPWNPDPAATVRFGLQTEQEMMYGFLFYVEAGEELGIVVDPGTGRALGG